MDSRIPLTGFNGPNGSTFDDATKALQGNAEPFDVVVKTATRTVRGVALAVDDSGIIRIGQDGKSGVRILVWRQDDTLYGEFVD